jgi:chemotaxis family two-component system response regulator PixG
MKTLPISRYRFFQGIQPLCLLKNITSKSATGCLQVASTSGSWSLYLDEGKLIYACYSEKMFEPLYRNLQRLSQQITTIPREIHQQLRAIFETGIEHQSIPNPDYLAICWLVNQKYLSSAQAAILIEQLALEVLETFLKLEQGSHEFIPDSFLDDLPKFCHLDLRLLVEQVPGKSKVYHEHNSSAWQSNQPAKSTSVKVELPNIKSPLATTKSYQQFYSQPSSKKLYTVFCIDDSPIMLNDINSFLDEQIFAVEILRIKPDLILLDVAMPNLDGYEICSLLRKHISFKKTPVIMVTGKTRLMDRAKAKIVGASGYLSKPFTQGDLLRTIFQHMV